MAYYNSIKTLLNNGKTFSSISDNNSLPNSITLNNSKDGFTIGDYIMILASAFYYVADGSVYISDFNVTGCRLLTSSQINADNGYHRSAAIIYIGQVLENNINISNNSVTAGGTQLKVYRLSNNS